MSSQVDYSFLDQSITPATKQTKQSKPKVSKPKVSKPVKKTPTKSQPKVSKMSMSQAPPNMTQSKPVKPKPVKPKVQAVYTKSKPTPQQKPVSVPVMSKTNTDKLKQSTNEKEYMKNLKISNSQNIDNDNTKLFGDIQSNQTELEMTPITIQKYSTIVNQMKKLFIQSKILLMNGDLITNILKYMTPLMNTISSNYKVNTQRSILSNIIMLLTYTNEKVSPTKIKAIELFRKKQQLKQTPTNNPPTNPPSP